MVTNLQKNFHKQHVFPKSCCIHLLSLSWYVSSLMSRTIKVSVRFILVADLMHLLISFNAKNYVSLSTLAAESTTENSKSS